MEKKMKGKVIIVLAGIALLTSGLKRANALEWSDEVQMTQANSHGLTTRRLKMVSDSNNVCHVIYSFGSYRHEGYGIGQPIYHRFNRQGESLSDPIFLSVLAGVEDSNYAVHDIFQSSGNTHTLLWGNYSRRVTQFDSNGNLILNGVLLEGVGTNTGEDGPKLLVDSQGNLILTQGGREPENRPDTIYQVNIFYARFDVEGRQIGERHVLWQDGPEQRYRGNMRFLSSRISAGDTLHFVWQINGGENGNEYTVHYSKIGPDDERVIDDLVLPSIGRSSALYCDDTGLDMYGRLVFLLSNNDSLYLMKLDYDSSVIYQTPFSRSSLSDDCALHIDKVGNSHVAVTYPINIAERDVNVFGYGMIDSNGVIQDSIQMIHNPHTSSWSNPQLTSFTDGGVFVIWSDFRWYDDRKYVELYSRYSFAPASVPLSPPILENSGLLLYSASPNPFNTSTTVRFYAPISGFYAIELCNLTGRRVWGSERQINAQTTGVFIWDGKSASGVDMPSGTYIISVQTMSSKSIARQKVVLLR